jgi:hypothetical protein
LPGPDVHPAFLSLKISRKKGRIDGFIISGGNHSFMSAPERDDENTYMLLFMLGAIILVFSLYLNVYFLFKAAFL